MKNYIYMKSKNNEIREHTANMQADTTGDVFTLDLEDGSGCQDWEPVTNKQKEKKKTLSARRQVGARIEQSSSFGSYS